MNEPPKEPVKYVDATVYLPYHYVAGDYRARYLHALKDKQHPRLEVLEDRQGVRPAAGELAGELRAVRASSSRWPDRGVVTTFCIVNIPVIGRDLELPYVAASVALDGADISIFAADPGVQAEDVRMGMRVEAVWKPDGERQGDHDDIQYFRPTGEPDAPPESFIHRL